jgi:hypothetical protein
MASESRIYVDEAGTHCDEWLVIGMLFVPNHGRLHAELCQTKEALKYFNGRKDRKARYKETHFAEFKQPRDAILAKDWIAKFGGELLEAVFGREHGGPLSEVQ